MRAATSVPRSARSSTSSISSSMARSSLRLVTRSATAVPERTRGSLQAARKPPPPAQFGCSGSGIAHVGGVLAVSRHERKSRHDPIDVPELTGGRNPGPRAPPRRADAGHRQARGAAGASRPQGRRQSGNLLRRACDSACRGRRCWPTGSTRIPPAVSCWDAIARPPPRSACCSSMARSARPIGRWSKADLPRMKAPSTCRSGG